MLIGNCEFSEDVLYDLENHTWARVQANVATVGLVSYMAWLTGRVTSVYFKEPGATVSRGAVIGSYEGPKYFGVFRCPVNGQVKRFNTNLAANPRLLQEKPYSEGWFAEIEDPVGDTAHLVSLDRARARFEEKIGELRVHCYTAVPDQELYAIGVECSAVLVQLNEYLKRAPRGVVVHVVSDEPTADVEMLRWAKQTGQELLEKRVEDGLHHYLVKKVV